MTSFYLAARYSRHPEMRDIRDTLVARGHTVTSRWIDQHGGDQLESAVHADLNNNPDDYRQFAEKDLADIRAADWLVSFTSADGGGKGGRHVEFGYGLGTMAPRLILVGPLENVFHTLVPAWCRYPDVTAFLASPFTFPAQRTWVAEPTS
jgi:hypothetical protein